MQMAQHLDGLATELESSAYPSLDALAHQVCGPACTRPRAACSHLVLEAQLRPLHLHSANAGALRACMHALPAGELQQPGARAPPQEQPRAPHHACRNAPRRKCLAWPGLACQRALLYCTTPRHGTLSSCGMAMALMAIVQVPIGNLVPGHLPLCSLYARCLCVDVRWRRC